MLLSDVERQDKPPAEHLRPLVDNAVLAEQLGFDGYGIGERHDRPAISSVSAVILSNIAAPTSTIRLFTTVTTLTSYRPVPSSRDHGAGPAAAGRPRRRGGRIWRSSATGAGSPHSGATSTVFCSTRRRMWTVRSSTSNCPVQPGAVGHPAAPLGPQSRCGP
ncbi:LLM class flavin-dependent oxidoreductase [Candidatus Protofrankia californiensis]|uniref:LLM class flavin-dependent oxidoreductase n=1 Tax=Candidatus Protofrankia californiensis TaxID=1839754 RepID=UPI003D34A7D8